MEFFVLLVCIIGVVSTAPVGSEEVEILPVEAQVEVENDPSLSKENKRVIRQHDLSDVGEAMLVARNPMEEAMYSPDCMPSSYYGRTHGPTQLDAPSYSLSSQHMPYSSAGFKYGVFGAQSATIPYPQESQIKEPQKSHTYFTTVPYISGYRMSPIYTEKKIIVKDYAHPDTHSGMMLHASNMHHPHEHYYRSADDMKETMLDRGMDFNIIFGQPMNSFEQSATSELRSADEYDKSIEDLRQRLEHLESLRQNINGNEEFDGRKDQLNFV